MVIHSVCPLNLRGRLLLTTPCKPLERLRKLDQHQGFVKGVCWDPVGEFLATQSDDRTVKIWRTTDWGLEAEVRKPFEDSPGTFFRRLRYVSVLLCGISPRTHPLVVVGLRMAHILQLQTPPITPVMFLWLR